LVFTAKKYEIKRGGKKSQKFIIDIIKDGAKHFFITKKVSKYLPDEDKSKVGLEKYYMKKKIFT
jgi:hypothetical protein